MFIITRANGYTNFVLCQFASAYEFARDDSETAADRRAEFDSAEDANEIALVYGGDVEEV